MNMDNEKIKQLEEIVDELNDDYDLDHDLIDDDEPRIKKIRQLTGCKLDAETIFFKFCFHYAGHCSLEETVYALMNNGEYPEKQEHKIYFWKLCDETNFTDEEICWAYRFGRIRDRAKSIVNKLEICHLNDIFTWVETQFPDWVREDNDKNSSKSSLNFYHFRPKQQKEYAIEEVIRISAYSQQLICVHFVNIDESIRNNMAEYIKSLGNTVHYPDENKKYPYDYVYPT